MNSDNHSCQPVYNHFREACPTQYIILAEYLNHPEYIEHINTSCITLLYVRRYVYSFAQIHCKVKVNFAEFQSHFFTIYSHLHVFDSFSGESNRRLEEPVFGVCGAVEKREITSSPRSSQ
jgi:hypothetical protein